MSPLPRFEKLPPARRDAILGAAAAEFAEHGFEGASFNRIIEASGVSKGAMYYYFADKADAYQAVLDEVMTRMIEAVRDLPEPTDAAGFWTNLAVGTERLTSMLFGEPQLGALARGLYARIADPAYRRMMGRTLDYAEALIASGQRLGAVRTDLPLDLLSEMTTGLLIAADRWFAQALVDGDPAELVVLAPRVLELTRNLLEPPGGKPDKKE